MRGYESKNNFSAVVAPTGNDDRLHGYGAGSGWIYDMGGGIYSIYECVVDDPGAANWPMVYPQNPGSGGGTVSSVGLGAPAAEFVVSGSPVTGAGLLSFAWRSQAQNKVFASPGAAPGVPSFRSLLAADVPNLPQSQITGLVSALAGKVPLTRQINTNPPLTGGGDLSTNRTLDVNDFGGDSGTGGTRGTVPAPAAGDTAAGKFLKASGGWAVPPSSVGGTVTSVGITGPSIVSWSGTPISTSGNFVGTLNNQGANTVLAGPTSGAVATPTFRALVPADLPTTAVVPGAYTNANIVVDPQGRITFAMNGTSAGTGTVTSVGFTAPSGEFAVSGSPIVSSGTLALTWLAQAQNKVLASPDLATGTPSFRLLVPNDIPNLPESKITSLVADLAAKAPIARLLNTAAPLTGGGNLSADRTLGVSTFAGDGGTGGTRGVVPAPAAGDAALQKFLSASGGWAVPPSVAGGFTGNYFDILDYGADPSGALDSAAGIQAAIDLAGAVKGVVLAPPGNYKIASRIKINKSLQWWGDGATLVPAGTLGTEWVYVGNDDLSRLNHVTIRGMKIQLAARDWTNAIIGIRFVNTAYVTTTDLDVGLMQTGIQIEGQAGEQCLYHYHYLRHVSTCKFPLRFTHDALGSVNEINFYGGNIDYNSNLLPMAGTILAWYDPQGHSPRISAIRYYGTSFQATNNLTVLMQIDGGNGIEVHGGRAETVDHTDMAVNIASAADTGACVFQFSGAANDYVVNDGPGNSFDWRVGRLWGGNPILTGLMTATDFRATGLPGATQTGRYVGNTNGGAPVTGTFNYGDWVMDIPAGHPRCCTAGGSPGTWT